MNNLFGTNNHFAEYDCVSSKLLWGDYSKISDPVVSIIIPTYKRPKRFMESLKSAINQNTDISYEIVVVDNDDDALSCDVLNIINEIDSPKVLYYKHSKNIGMFGNFNRGIELSRGEFITFCHDDDCLLPNCIHQLMKIQNITGNKLILSRWNLFDDNSTIIKEYKYPHIVKGGLLKEKEFYNYSLYDQFIESIGFGVGCLFNRRCLQELGGYDSRYYPSSDYALHVKYTERYGCVINNIPTFNYRHANNESFHVWQDFLKIDRIIRDNCIYKLPLPTVILRVVSKSLDKVNYVKFKKYWSSVENEKCGILDVLIVKVASFVHNNKGYFF